jgi:hypothetical protein
MHLSYLTSLQTLVLSGRIMLTPATLQLLRKLRLPSVKHLSLTDCTLVGSSQQQQQAQATSAAAAAAAVGSSSSSSQAGALGTLAGPVCTAPGQGPGLYGTDSFVPVLSAAFPACENLKLGSCDRLSIVGLAALLQQLPNLQRLWVCGLRDDGQLHFDKAPHNFVKTAAAAAQRTRDSHKRAPDGMVALEQGYCVPYDPSPPRKRQQQQARTQLPWELEWFLERGVVISLKRYGGAPAAAAAAAAGPSAAAVGPSGAAAAVPAGAVALPCAAVSGLKYVALVRNDDTAARVFTRYNGRLLQGVNYCIWNDRK